MNIFTLTVLSNDDLPETTLQITEPASKAENCHDLGSHSNIKSGLSGQTIYRTSQPNDDLTKCPVI